MAAPRYKVFRRNIRIHSIDVHPTEQSITVDYEVDVALAVEHGGTVLEEVKQLKKIIKIEGLSEDTDIKQLATDIVLKKCTLIPRARQHEVEQLLYYLQTRKSISAELASPAKPTPIIPLGHEAIADITILDVYIELMYDDLSEKIKASSFILQLARAPDNLGYMSKHELLPGILARVLREDGRKAIELSTNICYIFFCFSSYRQFHSILAQHKIGSLCMELIDFLLDQYVYWYEEYQHSMNIKASKAESEEEQNRLHQKYLFRVKKQDQLIIVCIRLLYNLSEDPKVEIKMISRNLVTILLRCAERQHSNSDLKLLVMSFLKKISVYKENIIVMLENNVIEKISAVISKESSTVLTMALRLLWNLSFDIKSRSLIVQAGCLNKFPSLLELTQLQPIIVAILYHISMEDRYRHHTVYSQCAPSVMKMIACHKEEAIPMHLIALAINMATVYRNARFMCSKSLGTVIDRALYLKDALIMKLLRNISQHDGCKDRFEFCIQNICKAITTLQDNVDYTIECIGLLGNMSCDLIDFEQVLVQYHLLEFLEERLFQEGSDDDFNLELIIFIGSAARDGACADKILHSSVMMRILAFLNDKQEDDEIVLQIVYLFYVLLFHSKLRKKIIMNLPQIPGYLIDLMHDNNVFIREYCDYGLDIVSAFNNEWASKVKHEKFRWHNSQWLDVIESVQNDDGDLYNEESYTNLCEDADTLSQSYYGSGAAAAAVCMHDDGADHLSPIIPMRR